ncbi:hypothetical protein D3C75_1107540 [compost metagenome]
MVLTYWNENGKPLWSQDLISTETTKGSFSDIRTLELSITPRVAEAKSQLLIGILGGTGLSLTGAGIYDFMKSSKEYNDWRIRVAILIGGATGYSVGYWFATHAMNNDSPELLGFLANKKTKIQLSV